MPPRTDDPRPSHPAIYAAHLIELCGRFGVSREALLEGTGVTAALLEEPDARLPSELMYTLVTRALALTKQPGLGFYFGLQLKLSTHGIVGFAAMTSATLGDAIRVATRFWQLRASHISVAHYIEGENAVIELTEVEPLEATQHFVIESHFSGLASMGQALIGRSVSGLVEVKYPEPPHFQGFAHMLPGPVRFRRPHHRMLFPKELLDAPLSMADSLASKHAIEACERELATLGERSTVLASVRRQMLARRRGFPSLTELSDTRGVSPRTLKRQLAAHGTSFQILLDELRRDRALGMLEDGAIPIERIAAELGYADPSNFNRAFRRWMGVAPTAWRELESARRDAP